MNIFGLISLFGGLALFLYGMSMLGSGLEHISGGRLEKTLEKLTSNIFLSVLLGAVVTAAVQSSSATTVIIVGLVNAKILKLRNAIGVIMGANIGTTVTAHVLRLSDISSDNFFLMLLKPTTLAPLMSIIGILIFMGCKKRKQKDIGEVLLGFGILFTGMFAMEAAVRPLSALPAFEEMFASFSNPVIGVLIGTLVTAIIQSSSASVGILQALSSTGQIAYSAAFPIIMGQNIGTTITPILASIGASKNAKRAAAVHVIFNVLGTIIFMAITYFLLQVIGFSFWDDPIDKGGIANFHSIFNVCITLMFVPFVGLLEKLACMIVKSDKDNDDDTNALGELDERFLVAPGLALEHAKRTVDVMGKKAKENYLLATTLFTKFDKKAADRLLENENLIDKIEDKVEEYLLKLSEKELSETESRMVSELLHITGEFERIGDHAVNIMECAATLAETSTKFSDKANIEINTMLLAVGEIIEIAIHSYEKYDVSNSTNIEPLEEIIDQIEEDLKLKHIDRLKAGKCSVEAAFPFVETLSNLERISDHCSNIGVTIIAHSAEHKGIERHEYVRKIHKGEAADYTEKYKMYQNKYLAKLPK